MTADAANYNFEILKENDFNLQKLLVSEPLSTLQPGSEFRPASLLAPIFGGHPVWPRLEHILVNGAMMRLHPISNKDRLSDLSESLEYGNHKSAVSGAPTLLKILAKEVAKGWQLPLPIN